MLLVKIVFIKLFSSNKSMAVNLKIHEGINELESLETPNLGQYSVEGQHYSFLPSGSVHPPQNLRNNFEQREVFIKT